MFALLTGTCPSKMCTCKCIIVSMQAKVLASYPAVATFCTYSKKKNNVVGVAGLTFKFHLGSQRLITLPAWPLSNLASFSPAHASEFLVKYPFCSLASLVKAAA